jgi:hypothetical protein
MDAREWHRLYGTLSEERKRALDFHLDLSTELEMWYRLHTHLMDEFHQKKAMLVRKKYRLSNETTNAFYETFFFKGRKNLCSLDTFPCAFKSSLESLMERTVTRPLGSQYNGFITSVYYRVEDLGLALNPLDRTQWTLEKNELITDEDRLVLERFEGGITGFFQKVIHLLEAASIECVDIRKELTRSLRYYEKAFTLLTL